MAFLEEEREEIKKMIKEALAEGFEARSILEEDLVLLPDGMDARVNERIKAQFEN